MNLILTVNKSPAGGAPVGTGHTIDQSGATIGRHRENTWVLPSVEGDGLSRKHCVIEFKGGVFSVKDAKSAYGVFLNDIRLKTEAATLHDGDRLRLGEYELMVGMEAPTEPGFGEQPLQPDPIEPDPMDPGLTEPESIPDEPFGWPEREHPETGQQQIIEDGAPMWDHVPPDKEAFSIPQVGGDDLKVGDDWMQPSPGRIAPERPPIQPANRPPIQPANRPPASVDGFQAFLAGASVPRAAQSGVDASAALRAAGETYRVAVEGISEILVSRNQVKDEFGIEKTRIAMAENNPLKSRELTTEKKLSMMIAGNRSAFMPASAAMKEALRDIKEHELALIAAIQVALKELLEHIDPKTLEKRLEKRLLDVVPGARKARIWEIYELKHAEIARELEEDFQGAFGRAFAQAYEQYVRRR